MPLSNQPIQSFEFKRDEFIEASPDVVFQAVLDEIGPESRKEDGTLMPLKLEAWPGGRWYRDTGNNTGHLWGHVQVIKPPTVLELTGPMFMSFAASNHVQYRLAAEGTGTRLSFVHRSIGIFPKELAQGMDMGWGFKINRVRELIAAKKK